MSERRVVTSLRLEPHGPAADDAAVALETFALVQTDQPQIRVRPTSRWQDRADLLPERTVLAVLDRDAVARLVASGADVLAWQPQARQEVE